MIYGCDKILFDPNPLSYSSDPQDRTQTAEPTQAPEVRPSETAEQASEGEQLRNVYDSDVSSTVLQKLSAYYNDHAGPFDRYIIFRSDQYTTRLIYGGASSPTSWTGATEVIYQTSSNFNGFTTFSHGRSGSITLSSSDLSGSTGYIYSSFADYPSSYYVETSRVMPLLMTMLLISAIGFVVYRWIHSMLYRTR